MDATTATSKAETAFHIGDVAPDENAGRLGWVEDNDYFNAAARRPFISFMLHCICLLLAQSGHPDALNQCPLLGVKRTSRGHAPMSGFFDPKRTLAAQICCDAQHHLTCS